MNQNLKSNVFLPLDDIILKKNCVWVKHKDQDNEMFSIICIYTESNSVVAAFTYIYRGDRQQSIL